MLYRPDKNSLKLFGFIDKSHPLFNLLGLRENIAQHTPAEHNLLCKFASISEIIVEIGVAEGGGAVALKSAADKKESSLFLVDPYLSGKIPFVNFTKLAAKKSLFKVKSGCKVKFIEKFSHDAVKGWNKNIDFLFIDGDHSYSRVVSDWNNWSPFINKNGYVAFHDARVFKNGWTQKNDGPVIFVDENFRDKNSSGWTIVEEKDSIVVVKKS